jgi:hypothetical protein
MTPKQAEAREQALKEIAARRAFEDVACRLGEERRDVEAALRANDEQMKALAIDLPRGWISSVAECLKVSRATVHRWRKNNQQEARSG